MAPIPTRQTRQRGRPPIRSNEELLGIAREVFLERGIRATTGEVAERAGVSEGTLFHRFKSKEALFREAMRFDPDQIPAPLADIVEKAGKGDLRATLLDAATRMLAIGRIALPMMMMAWSNPSSEYSLVNMKEKPQGYRRAFTKLCEFFTREIAAGRLRHDSNPEALARIFMGSLHHYCMTELVFASEPSPRLLPDAYVMALVELLLHGAAADRPDGSHDPTVRAK
jgi:AcrR family transcriptional regulator